MTSSRFGLVRAASSVPLARSPFPTPSLRAKRSNPDRPLDCFVAALLAMTVMRDGSWESGWECIRRNLDRLAAPVDALVGRQQALDVVLGRRDQGLELGVLFGELSQ